MGGNDVGSFERKVIEGKMGEIGNVYEVGEGEVRRIGGGVLGKDDFLGGEGEM